MNKRYRVEKATGILLVSLRRSSKGAAKGSTDSPTLFSRIYALVRRVPRGKVVTYGQIARGLGMPRGARTVGWAMRVCPDNIPWHRVVNASGKISTRPTAGFHEQRLRLKEEGVRFSRAGEIDLQRYGWNRI